jgi:hypothetical protein
MENAMSTYIDNGAAGFEENISQASGASASMDGFWALWSLPLTAVKIWAQSWSSSNGASQSRDRNSEPAALPLEKPQDSELFA